MLAILAGTFLYKWIICCFVTLWVMTAALEPFYILNSFFHSGDKAYILFNWFVNWHLCPSRGSINYHWEFCFLDDGGAFSSNKVIQWHVLWLLLDWPCWFLPKKKEAGGRIFIKIGEGARMTLVAYITCWFFTLFPLSR